MTKRIAVILSGCGNQDGSEITEAVSVLLALSEAGAHVKIFAPDQEFAAKNFLTEKAAANRAMFCSRALASHAEKFKT